ncbi:gamma-glutamyltransferase [Nonomuraea sp. NPDC049784]|uniref:gamma-glutamyltransferase n=1 Tax=Nonomuraea sp. NPDC049784 TaxID=3154361 RepID=UPI00340951E6
MRPVRPIRLLVGAAVLATATVGAVTAPAGADDQQDSQSKTVAIGTGGAVATIDPTASQAGIDVLRKGGNAVDAAVTVAAVLSVTEPWVESLGGASYLLFYDRREQEAGVIGDRTPAPKTFGPDDRVGLAGSGARSVGVPTTLVSWQKALDRYGTISLREALQPAIRIAREGFVVDANFQLIANSRNFKAFTSSRKLFLDDNLQPPQIGSVFRNPDLAATYELIAEKGVDAFYRGPIGQAIVDTVQHPPLAGDAGSYVVAAATSPGKLELSDIEDYRQPTPPPTKIKYRGYHIYSSPPPESGGTTVGEALNILERYDLSGPDRALALHRVLEASKLSYADRARYVGDPRFVDVPLSGLLSQGFADERGCLIGDTALQGPVSYGDPTPPYDKKCSTPEAGVSEPGEEHSTHHFSVVDQWGNAVSYTGTLVSAGGSGVTVPGYGFMLNNELTNFNAAPLYDGDPNLAAGGKRPRGNMAPTIVVRDGRPVLTVGVAGGQTIQTTVLSLLVGYLDFGQSLPEALADGRVSQRNTAVTQAETAFRDAYAPELEARFGHRFTGGASIAVAQGVSIDRDGRLVAVADTRRAAGAAGDARVVSPAG